MIDGFFFRVSVPEEGIEEIFNHELVLPNNRRMFLLGFRDLGSRV